MKERLLRESRLGFYRRLLARRRLLVPGERQSVVERGTVYNSSTTVSDL